MSVHTRMHHTKATKRTKISHENEKSIPWRELIKDEIEKYTEVGYMLRAHRNSADMTQKDLAKVLGETQSHISDMEHGRRLISKAMAKKLGKIFKCDYRRFL